MSDDAKGQPSERGRKIKPITNQKEILKKYASEHGFLNTRYYFDDGVTGTTFEREGFQSMIADIEKGEIKTVIVKDLSRLGRDHLMTGYYHGGFLSR